MFLPEGGGFNRVVVERAAHNPAVAVDLARARQLDELDLLLLARLEADGRAGGDVQAHAVGLGAVEVERAVDLEEVEVAADLYGAVARVAHEHDGRPAAGVRLNPAGLLVQ